MISPPDGSHASPPVVLTIAGSDSSAGAGVQADLKMFSALGVYGVTAVTCVVAEVPGKVTSIQGISAEMVRQQIEVLCANLPIVAVKTGLLFSREIVEAVAAVLNEINAGRAGKIPLVIDPVIIATSGDALLHADAIGAYEQRLFPCATLVTPNLDEAGALLRQRIAGLDEMRGAVEKLYAKYGVPFLLKGGHLAGDRAIDLLCDERGLTEFSAPFERGVRTHGTGCTYSAAIAAGLALGLTLEEAITRGKRFVRQAIGEHFSWQTNSATVHALNHFRLGEIFPDAVPQARPL